MNSTDSDDVEGLKDKKQEIRGDWGWPITNPLIVKLAFSSEIKNSPLKERWCLENTQPFLVGDSCPFIGLGKRLSVG